MKLFWLYIKSFFVCLHLPSSLTVNQRVKKTNDDGFHETWECDCTCKCGEEHVTQKFLFSKDFLNKTGIFAEKE